MHVALGSALTMFQNRIRPFFDQGASLDGRLDDRPIHPRTDPAP
jgi:UDP-galactopyranose mutase